MTRVLVLFMSCMVFGLYAQKEDLRYREVADRFQQAYNLENYGDVFTMFDKVMQQQLPLEKTQMVLSRQIRSNFGKIQRMELNQVSGSAHVYKSTFDRGTLDISISLNGDGLVDGLYFRPHNTEPRIPMLERNSTPVKLPFQGEWFVYWGGENEALNYHMNDKNQQYAFDFLKVDAGSSYKGDSSRNESYLAFGQPIFAPCDGTIVLAIDGVPDNIPGSVNPIHMTGNTLVLKTAAEEYILMAHLKEGSIVVQKGQQVGQGDLLGECGNSGNSTEPHLHLQLQNTRDIHRATGARLFFDRILVNGELKTDYLPIKEEFIKNIE